MSNIEISRLVGTDKNTVGRWRRRFAEQGIPGIEKELPRGGNHGGHNSEEMARLRVRLVEATTQEAPPDHAAQWSVRLMAKHLGVSKSFVHKVWQKVGLKPHLVRTFKLSRDPNFVDKLRDVVGLYLNPPDNAAVFSFDEKSGIQALDRTQPGLPLKKGRCGTVTHDYKRHGTTTLFAAMNLGQRRSGERNLSPSSARGVPSISSGAESRGAEKSGDPHHPGQLLGPSASPRDGMAGPAQADLSALHSDQLVVAELGGGFLREADPPAHQA